MTDIDRLLTAAFAEARGLRLSDGDVRHVVTESTRPAERERRTRRRGWLLALAPIALIGATAWYLARSPSTEELALTSIACMDAPRRDAGAAIQNAEGRDPVDLCKELWSSATIDRTTNKVPPLTPCVFSAGDGTGAIYVLPTADRGICKREGLEELPADYTQVATRLAGLNHLITGLGDDPCTTNTEAVARTRAEIERSGLGEWKVVPADAGATTCVTLALDAQRHEVRVLPVPDDPVPTPAQQARRRFDDAILAAFSQAFPGFTGQTRTACPDPGRMIAIVRRLMRDHDLDGVPLVIARSGSGVQVGFNDRMPCADFGGLMENDTVVELQVIPEVRPGDTYPTNAELQNLTNGVNRTFGLPWSTH